MLASLALAAAVVGAGPPADRLVYVATNLMVAENVAKLETLMARAEKAGYTGVMLADSKFCRLKDLPAAYFENCRTVKAAAAAHHLEIIPAVFPLGYSNDLLSQDPNLAEGIPVRGALFVTKGSTATLVQERATGAPSLATLGKWSWHDENVTQDGDAVAMRLSGGNARVCHPIEVVPHRQYHVSVKVRTRDLRGVAEVKAIAPEVKDGAALPERSLIFSSLGVKPTQEWTEHHAVFNTLDRTKVNLYLGCWGGASGELAWKDLKVEEVGLLNVVRRPGAPLAVTIETGSGARLLVEGVDYEPVRDPRMGHPEHLWPGEFEVWHEPPVITLKKPLPEGSKLRVSYHHAITVHDGQVMICPSEPKTMELLRDQAKRVHELWNAPGYWMSHDEIRCLNHDAACTSRGKTPGQLLAENARACVRILREVNPGGRIYVWSDMFDPTHNAIKTPYYLVNGDLTGSWEGLDRSVIIGAWNFGKRAESLAFFAGRKHPIVIAGYYDSSRGVADLAEWWKAAPKGAVLRGAMYTTWSGRYEELEGFGEGMKRE